MKKANRRGVRFGWALLIGFGPVGCGDSANKNTAVPVVDTCAQKAIVGAAAIVRFPYTITVDGDLNEAAWSDPLVKWNKLPATNNFSLRFPAMPSGDADVSAEFAVVADSQFMYFGVRVKDDSLQPAISATDNDGVEVYIDAGGEHFNGTPPEFKVSPVWAVPGLDCNDGQYALSADNQFRDGLTLINPQATKDVFAATSKKAADGYAMEWRFPLAMPGCPMRPGNIVLEEGSRIGLNVAVNDDDESIETCSPHADEPTCVADVLCKWDSDGKKCREKDTRQHQLFWSAKSLTTKVQEPWQSHELSGDAFFCGPPKPSAAK